MIGVFVRSVMLIAVQVLAVEPVQYAPVAVFPLNVRVTVPVTASPCFVASVSRLALSVGNGTWGDTLGTWRLTVAAWQLVPAQIASLPVEGTWLSIASWDPLRPNCGELPDATRNWSWVYM